MSRQKLKGLRQLLNPDIKNASRYEIRTLLESLNRYKEALNKYGYLLYFQPNLKQQKFFHPDREIFPRFRVFQGGNRSGKTHGGVLESYSFATGERLWDGTKTPVPVPNKGRIVATSYLDGIKKVIQPKIFEIFPEDMFEGSPKVGQQGSIIEVRLKNGSWFDLVSTEQEPMKHEGADRDWIWFDEPTSRAHWVANTRGLVDRKGYAWLTMTPLTEPWIMDEICEKAAKGDPNYFVVQASMYDNVGYGLTEEAVKEFEETLTEEEKSVRILGNFLALSGLIFKEYSDFYWPNGHLVKPFSIPEHWPRFCGVDPHDRTPTHITWFAVDPHDDIYAYDELVIGNKNVKEICRAIKEKESLQDEPGYRIVYIMDPASKQKSNVEEVGLSTWDLFTRNGVSAYLANNDIASGHKMVRELLRFRKTVRSDIHERPRLFVFDTCKALRHSFQRYVYEEWVGPQKDWKNPKEKPRDKEKHGMDTLRYVAMFNPSFPHSRFSDRSEDRWDLHS